MPVALLAGLSIFLPRLNLALCVARVARVNTRRLPRAFKSVPLHVAIAVRRSAGIFSGRCFHLGPAACVGPSRPTAPSQPWPRTRRGAGRRPPASRRPAAGTSWGIPRGASRGVVANRQQDPSSFSDGEGQTSCSTGRGSARTRWRFGWRGRGHGQAGRKKGRECRWLWVLASPLRAVCVVCSGAAHRDLRWRVGLHRGLHGRVGRRVGRLYVHRDDGFAARFTDAH